MRIEISRLNPFLGIADQTCRSRGILGQMSAVMFGCLLHHPVDSHRWFSVSDIGGMSLVCVFLAFVRVMSPHTRPKERLN